MPNRPLSSPPPLPTPWVGGAGGRPARPWRRVALAATLCATLAGNAWALALGRVVVQSQLGEPLRAEIDVPAITEAEAASLELGIAPPERFRAANLEFNPLVQDVVLTLQRRTDGRTLIVVRSERPVSEPFLDLVVRARWAGGELLRGYTLLFDPPHLRPPAPLAPAVAEPPAPAVTDVRPAQPVPSAPAAATAAPPGTASRPAAAAAPTAAKPASAARVKVQPGDTAGRIAAAHKPPGATLEQMLVALLRANPQAFIRGNVNLVRAGAVLDLPDNAQVAEVDAQEAGRLVAAQTRDFSDYRRRLAAAAPRQDAPQASRAATGTVQAAVAEAKPEASAQDKLTLTKPGSAAPTEERIAQARQRDETQQRVAELNRNLQELEQLRQATATAPADATTPAPAPAAQAPTGVGPQVNAAAPTTSEPAPAPAPEPTAPAAPTPAPAPAAPPTPPAPPVPPADDGIVGTLLTQPWTLPAAGGVAALLLALAWWRIRQRRRTAADAAAPHVDAVGQTVDTEDEAPASSMMYSPSQLDAGGDVDPVAEADVYLAYGRDQQAEEILLEALRLHPDRLPVRLKLLEIYAQRRDVERFAAGAHELHTLTDGQGPEWERACELGQALDPDNPLYRPARGTAAAGAAAGVAASATDAALRTAAAAPADVPELDLRFDAAQAPVQASPPPPPADDTVDLDFDLDLTAPAAQPSAEPTRAPADEGLDFDLDLTTPAAPAVAEAPAGLPPSLEGLSLDLPGDEPPAAESDAGAATAAAEPLGDDLSSLEVAEGLGEADPLETKLSLAREFEAIGDIDGARTLAEEVVAEASGELQERARAFLAQLA